MCNLYRMTRGVDEVARLFEAVPDHGANLAEEVYPGYPGLVVAEGRARAQGGGGGCHETSSGSDVRGEPDLARK